MHGIVVVVSYNTGKKKEIFGKRFRMICRKDSIVNSINSNQRILFSTRERIFEQQCVRNIF